MTYSNETRPHHPAGARSHNEGDDLVTSDSLHSIASHPYLSAAEIQASRPSYVLIVKTPADRITRRVFLSLHGAVKACERAQARGNAAHLELCRLVPYMTGAELHAGVSPDA